MSNMADGLNMAPRPGEPESAMLPGMAVPAPRKAVDALLGVGALSMPDTSGPGAVAAPSPAAWVYDFDPATGVSRATYNGEVSFTSGGSATAGVTTFNTRSGAVTLLAADVTGVGGIVNPSANLTGVPTAATAAPGTSTTQLATCQFVAAAIVANPIVQSFNGRTGAITLTGSDITTAGGAVTASPAFTGSPTAPTVSPANDASSKIATTQFVSNAIASGTVTSWNGRGGAVSLLLTDVTSVGGAPINSPVFTGNPQGTTAAPGTATTQLATTAFVTNAIVASTGGVTSFNTRSGAVTLQAADVTGVGGALLVSPIFTGTPQGPTPTAGDQSGKLATTQFVATAISNLPSGVTSFNTRTGAITLQLTDVTNVGGAPLAAPTFTGVASSPTPTAGDNSTRIATTAFVGSAVSTAIAGLPAQPVASTATPLMDGVASAGSAGTFAQGDHVHPTDTSRVAKAGDTMTGALTTTGLQVNGTQVLINKAASGAQAAIVGTTAGSTRWGVQLGDTTAESGGSAGSNFSINRYNDAGTYLSSPITSIRSNGNVTLCAGGGAVLMPTNQLGIGTANLGVVNNVASLNWSTSGLVCEGSAQAIWANKIGANGVCIQIGQGATACGSITVANGTSTAYNTASDGRLKEDLRPFDAGAVLDAIETYDFRWKATENRAIGVVAQEVEPIFAQAVHHDEDRDRWEVDYSKFVPLLLAEVKALRKRVIQLEAALHSGGQG